MLPQFMRIFSGGVMTEQFGCIPTLKKITNIISRHKIICTSKVENDLKSLLISNN